MAGSRFTYHYQPEYDRTTAVLDGSEMTVALRPSRRPGLDYEVGFFPNDGDGDPIVAQFTVGGFNEFVNEAQRMRSGCFAQQWPKPTRDYELERLLAEEEAIERAAQERHAEEQTIWAGYTAPTQGPLETVADLVNYLEENYSASAPLLNVSVDTDECLIRIG